jgi:hypothetical protein
MKNHLNATTFLLDRLRTTFNRIIPPKEANPSQMQLIRVKIK